jgi:hypothetical protein
MIILKNRQGSIGRINGKTVLAFAPCADKILNHFMLDLHPSRIPHSADQPLKLDTQAQGVEGQASRLIDA